MTVDDPTVATGPSSADRGRSDSSEMGEGNPGDRFATAHRREERVDEIVIGRRTQRTHDTVMLDPDEERRTTSSADRRHHAASLRRPEVEPAVRCRPGDAEQPLLGKPIEPLRDR